MSLYMKDNKFFCKQGNKCRFEICPWKSSGVYRRKVSLKSDGIHCYVTDLSDYKLKRIEQKMLFLPDSNSQADNCKNYLGLIEIWNSCDGYLINETEEDKAEVEKIMTLWEESKNIKGYNPQAKESKVLSYNCKKSKYSISVVTEHSGVEYISLDKKIARNDFLSNKNRSLQRTGGVYE